MKLLLLVFTTLMVSFSTTGQDNQHLKLPPIEMLGGKPGEVKQVFTLPDSAHYTIFNTRGEQIDSGYAEFIDYSDFEAGTYFLRYNGQTTKLLKEHEPGGPPDWTSLDLIISLSLVILVSSIILLFYRIRLKRIRVEKTHLMAEIAALRKAAGSQLPNKLPTTTPPPLDQANIEATIDGKLNESDLKIVHQLLNNPSISNKDLADKVSLSVEGTRSALKKMYRLFEIPSSRNMRLALVLKLVRISQESGS